MHIEEKENMENVCSDCRHDPEAKRPFAKMHYFKMTDLTRKCVSKLSKETKSNPNCTVCEIVRDFTKELRKNGND